VIPASSISLQHDGTAVDLCHKVLPGSRETQKPIQVTPAFVERDAMVLELHKEYPQANEREIFDAMIAQTVSQMHPIAGFVRRGQHAKATGCVEAELRIAETVPNALQHGVFAEPGRRFAALVRFSNSQGTLTPDGEATGRGIAIKLLDVPGRRAIEADADRSQDFLMINHPVFPFPDPESYLKLVTAKNVTVVGGLLALLRLSLREREQFGIVSDIRDTKIANPLEAPYWSGSPFWLGSADGSVGQAVKYSVVPREIMAPLPDDPETLPSDYLSDALRLRLRDGTAVFDFKVQIQTDPTAMPIENASVLWDETVSVPASVATLSIPSQDVEALNEAASRCERLSFNPWHALAEHRPMGGINRLRRAVYEASFKHRTA